MPVRYELLLRFNETTGALKGALARYSDGSLMPITPETLGDHLSQATTDALAANAALSAQVAAATEAKNGAVSALAAMTAERDALQARIDAASPPGSVSALAFELVLIQAGMIDAVRAYVGTQSAVVQAYWRRQTIWRRDSQLIEAARVALGLTAGQVDALFTAARNVQT
jgi:hypothetical protein